MRFFDFNDPIAVTVIAAAASIVLSPLSCRLAERVWAMDVPSDGRRMHRRAIPRCGGIAVCLAIMGLLAISGHPLALSMTVGGGVIFLAGAMDDLYSLPPTVKLLLQALSAALTLLLFGGELAVINRSPLYYAVSLAFIVTVTNAFNLIDGLDGLCPGITVLCGIFIFLISGDPISLVPVGAMVGFMPYNSYPARMFLGDSGAMPAGYFMAVCSLGAIAEIGTARVAISMLAVLFLPLFDTVLSFVRRLAHGRSPFTSDRGHIHHRLIDSGLAHPAASGVMVLLSGACGGLGVSFFYDGLSAANAVCLMLLLSGAGCLVFAIKKGYRQ